MEKHNIKWQYERVQETTQDPNTKNIKETIQTQKLLRRTKGGLNPDPYGSCPPSSNLHNPLKLESNLQTHMLAYANPKKLIQWLNTEATWKLPRTFWKAPNMQLEAKTSDLHMRHIEWKLPNSENEA
jgi:hypothetical protein